MLQLNDTQLTGSLKLNSVDNTITLSSDKEVYLTGVFVLSDESLYPIEFVKVNDIYKARFVITSDIVKYLSNAKFYVNVLQDTVDYNTNKIDVECNLNNIKLLVKREISKELLALRTQIKHLEEKIDALDTHKVLSELPITNKEYIEEGMVPIAVGKGLFKAGYPFASFIKSVNSVEAFNGNVDITAANIPYTDSKSVFDSLKDLSSAVVQLYEYVESLKQNQSKLSAKLDDLLIRFETHINSGII